MQNRTIEQLVDLLRREWDEPIDHEDLNEAADTIESLLAEGTRIRAVVDEQAEDEGLWFEAQTAPEAYLQSELRRLHEVIEGKTGDECAREILAFNRQEKSAFEKASARASQELEGFSDAFQHIDKDGKYRG